MKCAERGIYFTEDRSVALGHVTSGVDMVLVVVDGGGQHVGGPAHWVNYYHYRHREHLALKLHRRRPRVHHRHRRDHVVLRCDSAGRGRHREVSIVKGK